MARVHGLAGGHRYTVTMKKPDPGRASTPPSALLDRIGATGSLVCAVHCAVLPLLIALLPSLGIAQWLGEGFERGFVVFASLYGVAILAWSYRRHRTLRALVLLLPGLAAPQPRPRARRDLRALKLFPLPLQERLQPRQREKQSRSEAAPTGLGARIRGLARGAIHILESVQEQH